MNKINDSACMNQISYSKPECQVLVIKTEGLLCMSAHTFAAEIRLADELGTDDFTQIF